MLISKGKLKQILLMFGFDDAVGYCGGHACFLKEWFSKIGDFFLFFREC